MARYITYKDLIEKLGAFKSVKNAPSRNGEGVAANQFILTFENGYVFQSYDAVCAAKVGGETYLTRYHDYSNTTALHVGRWLGRSAKERREGMVNGDYIVVKDYER